MPVNVGDARLAFKLRLVVKLVVVTQEFRVVVKLEVVTYAPRVVDKLEVVTYDPRVDDSEAFVTKLASEGVPDTLLYGIWLVDVMSGW